MESVIKKLKDYGYSVVELTIGGINYVSGADSVAGIVEVYDSKGCKVAVGEFDDSARCFYFTHILWNDEGTDPVSDLEGFNQNVYFCYSNRDSHSMAIHVGEWLAATNPF